jgi:hypothetical protein
VKRTGTVEPIRIIIRICLEATQGISLCSHLYLKLAKMPCFSYYLLCFFFYKIREQEDRSSSAQGVCWGVGTSGRGERGGGRERRTNMVQIMHAHVCKCENDTC